MDAAPFDTLRGRSVFLTGHTGFKGSWLAIWLGRLGARVTGYALPPPTDPSNYVASGVSRLLTAEHIGDIRDLQCLTNALQATQPDIVFHFAAQALVQYGYTHPRETFEVNLLGTINLLESLRALGRPCAVIIVTSDKCYAPRPGPTPFVETDPLGGDDPYSASKGTAELAAAAYRRSYFSPQKHGTHRVSLATVRAGNVIGGGDWAMDRLVPDLVSHLAANRPVPIRNPRAVRPWQHVLDPLAGYLQLASRMLAQPDVRWCDAWNFAPASDQDITVTDLARLVLQSWGGGSCTNVNDIAAPAEAAVLRLSAAKAREVLGWRPCWTLPAAVCRTVQWYRQYYASSAPNMLAVCEEDIAAYEAEL